MVALLMTWHPILSLPAAPPGPARRSPGGSGWWPGTGSCPCRSAHRPSAPVLPASSAHPHPCRPPDAPGEPWQSSLAWCSRSSAWWSAVPCCRAAVTTWVRVGQRCLQPGLGRRRRRGWGRSGHGRPAGRCGCGGGPGRGTGAVRPQQRHHQPHRDRQPATGSAQRGHPNRLGDPDRAGRRHPGGGRASPRRVAWGAAGSGRPPPTHRARPRRRPRLLGRLRPERAA